jgi:hypothetical protein
MCNYATNFGASQTACLLNKGQHQKRKSQIFVYVRCIKWKTLELSKFYDFERIRFRIDFSLFDIR